jgi:hypothetical protein
MVHIIPSYSLSITDGIFNKFKPIKNLKFPSSSSRIHADETAEGTFLMRTIFSSDEEVSVS